MDRFIKKYHKALSSEICRTAIQKFEDSDNRFDGLTSSGVNKKYKSSYDLMINDQLSDPTWKDIYDYILESLFSRTVDYISTVPFIFPGTEYSSRSFLIRAIHQSLSVTNNGYLSLQMQRYIDTDGYYSWHFENEGGSSSARQLFFIFYLNDIDGGETEFLYSGDKISPEEGLLVLAPAFWTHTHRGNSPGNGQTKYIITGWIESTSNGIKPEF